jgi:CRISPR type III-associated protein (TIGR04423 family)
MRTLEKAIYTGYLWYSDQQNPQVYNDNKENAFAFDEQSNPFVVEGYLTDGKSSYAIKYIGGKYHIQSYKLSNLQDVEFDDVVVYTHRMENVQKMKFRQYWRPVEDDLCEGMTVLQPAELVFVGFEK